MKRLFLICFVCATFIGCNKPFTEETVSDLAIKTLSAFEAEVKNPDNDLVAIVGELCEKAGMEIDKSIMVDDAENAVLYNILMEEGPTFEIGVEDYDQYTNVHIGFVYPKDVTQGNGIPKKLYNNLVSTLTSSGMEFYTGYSDPKNINPITPVAHVYINDFAVNIINILPLTFHISWNFMYCHNYSPFCSIYLVYYIRFRQQL